MPDRSCHGFAPPGSPGETPVTGQQPCAQRGPDRRSPGSDVEEVKGAQAGCADREGRQRSGTRRSPSSSAGARAASAERSPGGPDDEEVGQNGSAKTKRKWCAAVGRRRAARTEPVPPQPGQSSPVVSLSRQDASGPRVGSLIARTPPAATQPSAASGTASAAPGRRADHEAGEPVRLGGGNCPGRPAGGRGGRRTRLDGNKGVRAVPPARKPARSAGGRSVNARHHTHLARAHRSRYTGGASRRRPAGRRGHRRGRRHGVEAEPAGQPVQLALRQRSHRVVLLRPGRHQ
jgi:hypothetical protein